MHLIKGFFTVSCLSALALLGCAKNPTTGQESGSVSINLVAAANSGFSAVAKTAEVTVSADGMPTLTQSLTVTTSGISGTVTGIVAGLNRKFEVFVYDASSKLCYYGSAVGEVTVGGTANVSLTLYKTNGEGNATINGTIQSSNTPPVVSLTGPANNAQFTVGSTIVLAATASDADGSVGSVAFYSGTTLLTTDNTAPFSYNYTASTPGTYTFSAVATDNAGASTTSATVTVTVIAVSQTSYKINCGGSASSPFTADQNFSGGTAHTVTNAITVTGITNAAPQAVYQSERYGTSTYTLPNLTSGAQQTVRLHFAELYWTATGKRKFNVTINGTAVLSNFDIYAAAGAQYKAVVREFTATANSSGQIVIKLTSVTDNATIGGIEIIPAATAPVITVTPGSQTVSAGTIVTISASATGGTPPYKFNFDNGMWGTTNPYSYQYDTHGMPSSTYNYSCTVTDAAGIKTTSPIYTLTIIGAPVITVTPQSQTVCAGTIVTISASATGGTAPYKFNFDNGMWGTTNPYTYQYDTYGAPNGTYTYSCFVTDANGLKTTSPTYTLTIKGAPTITTQPVGFSVCQYAFSSNSLQVKVPSGASYQYQWYAASNGQPVNGETSANFGTTPSATAGYYCILTDPLTLCTTQSSTATITILPIPASLPNITNTSWSPGSGSDAATGNLWVQIDNPGDGSQVYYSITNTSDHAYDVSNKLLNFNGNYAAWPAVAYGYETTAAGAVTVSCYRVNANGCSSSQTFWYNTAAWPQ